MATFADILIQLPSTHVRRVSWPAHWWCTLDIDGEAKVLKYTALLDLGAHPFGAEMLVGESVTHAKVPTLDAVADDWEIIEEPLVEKDDGPLPSLAIYGAGKLVPLAKCPVLPGYREMTVLVPETLFAQQP